MPRPDCRSLSAAALVMVLSAHSAGAADLIVSMNDNHTVLDADANQVAASPMRADTADISQSPPRVVQTFEVPGSVVGPPSRYGSHRISAGPS